MPQSRRGRQTPLRVAAQVIDGRLRAAALMRHGGRAQPHLDAAVQMLLEEGLDNVFARHDRHAEATRRAVRAWGLDLQCADPRHYSSSLTAVRTPDGHGADNLRAVILEKYNMSLGNGLGQLKDRVFRIGHLGDFGDLQLIGTLGGVEMGLRVAGVPHKQGGVQAAIDYLAGNA